ncbi:MULTISPECIES: DUF4062 domain-containing protein [Paraburkholderia]|uniref:DUF4062 domain-containing protein n=1 Tax=Paraburkholderia madseniana TaxID=2599607 RepID=A0AAP5EWJ5_9BURK|nr:MULTISPECIES: DUF4062 domain-containing protein [Paraburkholderia]MCX4146766.1 DUF4062 domain-containing protein [Paraburkholderia madseniana]MDN7149712.1 DUF4062 domain-containing protein [Paraburkholderia sp. WS6]MDQ6408592.1 DUF4062 domain-containing protein [Paraburkholderia madseniana]
MDKKYQVFISSTFTDMKAERQAAVEAILNAGHIPAGMELFSASDKKQIEVIKGWIDRSDIFMLILGGRYGSVDPESGKSYIQQEYEYAVARGKPFFALYLTEAAIAKKAAGELGLKATERDDTKAYIAFRDQVKNRLCAEVEDVKDIKINVPNSIRDLAAANKLEGWMRASNVESLAPLMDQLASLRAENARLADELNKPKAEATMLSRFTGDFSEKSLDAEVKLHLEVDILAQGMIGARHQWVTTYREILTMIGPSLLSEPFEASVHAYLGKLLRERMPHFDSIKMLESSFQELKMKLAGFGVVNLTSDDRKIRWTLTENGKSLLVKVHAPL